MLLLLALLINHQVNAQTPEWAINSVKKSGDVVEIVCAGTGPDLGSARLVALGGCRSQATEYLASNIKANNLIIESTKSEVSRAITPSC